MRFERITIEDRFPATSDSRGNGRDIEVCGFGPDYPARDIDFKELSVRPTQDRKLIDPQANGYGNIRFRYVRDVRFGVVSD
jgi:hypothetical protein